MLESDTNNKKGFVNLSEGMAMKEVWLSSAARLVCLECDAVFFPPKLKGPLKVYCSHCASLLMTLEDDETWLKFDRSRARKTRDMRCCGTFYATKESRQYYEQHQESFGAMYKVVKNKARKRTDSPEKD